MKTVLKSLVSLVLLIAFSVVLHAQQPYRLMQNDNEKIHLRLNSTTLSSVEVKTEAGYFSRLMMDQFHSSVQVGDPELPTLVKLIEIPLCDDIELTVTPGEFIIYDAADLNISYPVFPAQPSYEKSYEGPITLIKNDSTYEQNQFFAAAPLVTVKPIGQMRDYNLAELAFSPVSYNPVTGQLKVYQSVEVEIRFVNSRPEETAAMKRVYGTPMMSIPGSLLMNPPAPQSAEMDNTPIKMVIVSHPIFETQLAPYIEWKKRKGFIVDLALTSNPNVGTTTATIKNYLKAQYDNATDTDPAPTFVLFVGDVAQVPTFQGVTDDHVTDLYYVTFTDGDYLPDAYYGRFSATNSTELAPQLEKTLMYEMFTMPDPTYLDDAVLVAGTDNNWSLTHANGQVNYLSDNYINTGYGYSNIYKHLYPASLQAALIRQEIGNGVGFANYSAHCSPAGWGDPAFTTQHVPAMNNENKYGLMIGNCCQSGMFNNSVCFGEALLRADKKGAMAYIGASNYTYWNEDFYWAVGLRATVTANPVYQSNNLGAYDRLFHTHDENYNEWMVSNMGICQAGNLAVQSSTSERKKYYWEVYHLFGDPSVISYLTQPEVMDVTAPEVLTVGISSLPLTVAPYAYVALVKDGVLIGANFADGTGAVTLTFNPLTETGEYELAAWGQNYQQYFDTINVIDPSGAGCLAPIGITCTNATNTSMAIDWVDLVTANSWKIEYGVSGFTQGTGTVVQVTAHPATIIGLTASTCYDFYVQPICASSGPGDWSQKQTFCTHQIPLNVPFTIDFETPSGFGFANNPSGANWYIGNATGVNNTTGGNNGLYISGDNGNINMYDNTPGVVWAYRDVYFTPSTIDYVLTFDWKCLGEEYFDYFNLYIGSPAQPVADNTGTITMPAGATALATFMGLQDSWREASYILSAADYSGQTKRLYFCWKNNDSVVNQPPAAIDNIRLKVLSCFSPSELVASTITGNSVTLVWNENSSATAWEVEYGAPGFIIGTVVQAGTNPFILTGLNPYTPYEVRVRAVCNVNDYSMWSSRINFTTACGTFELPFFDDFSISPACWTQTYSGGVTSNRWEYISNGTFAGGTAGEMRARYVTGTGVSRLISPLVRFNNATAAELSFKHYYINDGPGVTIKLQCSPDLVTWTDLPFSHSGGNINPTTELVQFVPMADSLYFAWVIDGNHYNIYYWFIDDVSITSGCLTPVEVSFSNITTTSVDIEWVDFIAGNAWEVEYGTPGFTSGTIVPVSTIPFTLTGLDHSTMYEVRVRNICGDNEHGPWSSRVRFVTTCLSKELPFLEDFSAPPACWTQTYSGGITSERWSHFPYSTITGGTDAGEMRATWVNETGVSRLISPLIRFDDVVAAELSFRHYYSNDVPGVVLKVQCSSDLETWTDLSFSHSGGSIPAITQIIQFIPMADSLYFAWVIDGNHYSINYWYIDDVSIIETSGCMFPTEITYSNVTTTTVDIGWVDPAIGYTWEVEYGIPGFTSGTVVPASTNSITLTGLNHSTTYEFRVRTICDVNDYSTWSMRVSFSTLCSATELPFLEDFSTLPLCWGQTYSGGITSDVWGYDPGGMEAGGSAGELVAVWTDGVGVTRLISPLIRLNDVVGLELSFKHYYDNDNPGVLLKVQCSPDLETWTDLPFSHSGGDIAATTEIIQFVPIEDSLYFAWVMDGDHYDIHYWHIDDVSIIEKIVCVTPVGVSYSNVTPTSVDIEWVDPAIGNTWEVEYGAPGFISGTVVQASTNPFTLTGLNHSTAYEFRVRAVCGVDEYSMWSSRVSFVTTCLATELPFLEDFSAPPACWTQTYSGEITSDRWDYSPYGTDAGGDAGEMVGSWINGVGVSRLISPLISFDNVAAAELSFKHYYDYFSSGVTIKLQCSPDLLTWTDLSFSHSSGDIFATTEIIQFVPIADSLYFAWVVDGDHYSFDNWYIDDVSIISGCLTPLEVSCSNVTSNSVDIEWVDHTVGNTWEIEYGESGFTQGTGATVQTITHPVTISGLTALTCYDIYVKAICAPGEESNWSLKRTFCTSQNPVEVPFMIDFETESGFEFANNSSGNNWYVGNAAEVNNTTGGSNGLYISSNGGTTNIYNNTNAVVWAYRDIYFTPSTSDYTLSFDWKCRGERLSGTSYDYFNVYIGIPALPVARTSSTIMVPAGATALATRLNQQTSWLEASYILPVADYSGQTMRLYFCWRNDYSGAYQPPAAIDNIGVTSDGIINCFPPTDLTIANISSTGATATWTAGGSETSWQVEYKTTTATSWTTQTVTNPTYTMTGLQPSTDYEVKVKSLCGTSVESPYTTVVTFTTSAPPCVAPINLAISNISSTEATATWTAGGSETSWQIEYKTAAATSWTTQVVNTATYTMTGLQPSTVYEVKVKSLCDAGAESDYTAIITFTTLAPPCVAPINLAISNISSTEATATWTAGGSETSWQIEYKTAAATSWTTQVVNTPTYTMTGLQPSTDYEVKVKSLCGTSVESPYTTVVTFTTSAPPCVAPTNLAISNISSSGATATWTAGGSETSWQIEYKTTTATSWTTQVVNTATYTMTGLQPSTAYQVRVKSLCGTNVESPYTTVVTFTTSAPPCVAPINLAISNLSSTGATATWTAGGSETSWQIEYKTAAATSWTTQVVNTATYTMTGLQPSTAYQVRVKSLCGTNVESPYTTTVTFTTAAPPCVAPISLAISNISSTEATATWTAGGSETSWQIEYKTTTATSWTTQVVNTATYTMTGLQPSTAYQVRVKSLCGTNVESPYTTVVTFTTSAPPCVAPINLAISNLSSTGATATWTAGGSETSWQIEYKTAAATSWTTQVVNTATYTMTGLQPSTAYQVRVKSLCGTNVESPYTTVVSFTTSAPPCVAPINLAISNISSTGATATWTAGGSETSWQIEYKTTTATSWTTQVVNTATYTMTGLQPSTAYQVRVKSLCGTSAESPYTTVVTFTTAAPPCVAPTNLAISNISSTGATATWTAGGSETSWQIEYKTAVATTWTTQVVNTATYTMTGLQPSTAYQVRVKSLCGTSAESPYTTVVTFTTAAPPCVAPTNLAISNISSTGATATWIAGGSETSWQIEYKTAAATSWTTQVVNTATYTMTGLQPSTVYEVKVKSLCDAGAESDYTAIITFTTLAPPCVAPINLAISNISSTGATATWTAGGSETSWQIEYKTAAATSWTTQVVNTATYTMTGLQPSTAYQVRVKSLCGTSAESPYTTVVTFTTAAPPCVAPTNLAISNISSTGATATWTAGGSETSWQIEYKTAVATTWTTQVVNTATYTMTGLQPSTAYQVRVKSLCGTSAESPYTTVVTFTTAAPPCVAPTNLAISNISSTGATATWTAGGSETSWQIEYKTAAATSWTTQVVNTPTYTMTGLQPSTDYEVKVKSLCDAGAESDYTAIITFTTLAPPCVAPINLAISNISSTGATATWTAGGSETSWQIDYKTAAATSWTTQVVNTATYTMTGLQPSTAYQVRVKSLCGTSAESPYTTVVTFTTAAPPCVAPTNLAISNISSTGATATWTAGGSETSWQIEYKTAIATTWTTQVVNTATYTMTGLQPSTAYQVRVKSLCGTSAESPYTTVVTFTTAAPPCVAPTNLAISNISSTGATATWTAGGSETSWQIEYKTAAATSWTTQVVNTPTYTMTGLQPSTDYEVKVKSLCGTSVESPYTTVVSFTTAAPPCVAPINLDISNISSTEATATWTAGGSETSWQIEYKTAATSWTTQVVTASTYTMTGLQPSTNYQVRVKSLCDAGVVSSYTVVVSFTTLAPSCVSPNNLSISNIGSTGATATWVVVGTETSWQIEYKTAAATNWTVQDVTTPNYTMTDLESSTNYQVRVRSLCDAGVVSPYTAVVSFTTLAPPCVVPINLAISNISSTGATATWTAGGSETSWQIEYKTAAATSWTTEIVVGPFPATPTYTLTGLQPSTDYEVKVKSLCANGVESDYTTVVSFTTAAPPCVVPTNLAISNISSTGATATWTAGGSETSWQIEYKTAAATSWTTQVVNTPTYTMTGLQPSTDYEVKVKSLCGTSVESPYTTTVTFTTAAPPCVAPISLAISNISSTEATATWTAGGSETSWQIEYKTAATSWTTQVVNTATYTMTGLQPSTAYQVRVKSLCGTNVESPYTAVVSFTTAAPPCVVPTNLAISNISSTGATATWTAGGSETSWQIEYKTAVATTWTTQVVNTPTYTMTGLQPSTDYEVKVKSLCGTNVESPYTAVVSFTTAAPPCVAPINLAISNISSTGATATWTSGGSETSWQIEYKTAAATSWTTQVVNTATYTMTGLQPSTAYEVRVKLLCGTNVESPYTTVVSFTTAAPPCVTPTNLAISNISSTEATATWTAGGSETSWQIEYKTAAATTWTTQVVNIATYTMTGLQPSTAYEVKVKSLCDGGAESDYTDPITFTTDAIPTYTITATAGPHGTITPSGDVTVNQGESQTFTFTPEEGYLIDVVLVDNEPQIPVPESYTFENIQANHTIYVDFTVGIDKNELSRYVTLYPNPTQSLIDLKVDRDYLGTTECRIYDMYGKLMRILPIEEDITTIDVSDFAVGVYFVRLITEQGQVSKRFVKQ